MFDFFSKPFGLHITDSAVYAAPVTQNNVQLRVIAAHKQALAPGIVANGRIMQQIPLANAITELLTGAQPQPITSKKCIVAIPESQSYEHIFHFPAALHGEDLAREIAAKIADTIPLSPAETKFDFVTYSFGKEQIVFAVAVPRVVIAEYFEVLKSLCSLHPIIFEPELFGMIRNLPLSLDVKAGFIFAYVLDGYITWSTLWLNMIFDSARTPLEQVVKNPKIFLKDLEASQESFHRVSGLHVKNVLIAGQKDGVAALQNALGAHTALTVTAQKNFRTRADALPPDSMDELNVAIGLALKNIPALYPSSTIDLLRRRA